jgi:hypothetical protein
VASGLRSVHARHGTRLAKTRTPINHQLAAKAVQLRLVWQRVVIALQKAELVLLLEERLCP